ncbi:MAG: NapC/NirT family cytochrome c [Kangiellaceae bacterium]|nr:NapC/NirT family cytochrome c [Kangiellaceae bacterium]
MRFIGRKLPLKYIVLVAFFFGIFATVGTNKFVTYTNSETFCISCHEMADNVYQEFLDSPHDVNPSGVRATCADCHVPHEFGPLVMKKIIAVKDVYHWILGTMDTPEKFEEHRLGMAKVVWAYMKESDSRECRSCHKGEAMDFEYQDRSARRKHQSARQNGMTCIDCHKGIAHELPDMDEEESSDE